MSPPGTHAAVAPGETDPGKGVQRFGHTAMATLFEIRCVHPDPGYARKAAHEAFALIDRLEQEQSRFIANSDVARINHLSPGEETRVSPRTMECLEIAKNLHALTQGAFDVAIGSGLEGLELDRDRSTVVALAPGIRLDLGGIGKGYAVDRMAELLEEWDIERALVHGGFSSVVTLEAPSGRDGWPLTLSAPPPGEPRVLARLSLRQTAVSASGIRKGDHIRDPRTGQPVAKRAVWVAVGGREPGTPGSPGALAEALSTAFMVLPREATLEVCKRSPGVEAWLFEEEALVHLP